MRRIRRLFRHVLFRSTDVVRDVDDEIAFHIAMREDRLRANGVATDTAAEIARNRFGDVVAVRDECLDWALQDDRRIAIDRQLSDDAFATPMLRWMLPALKLSRGAEISFSTFSIWTNGEDKARLTVNGEEAIDIAGKRIETWVIQSPSGAQTWIDKSSSRIVQTRVPGGRDGSWMVLR